MKESPTRKTLVIIKAVLDRKGLKFTMQRRAIEPSFGVYYQMIRNSQHVDPADLNIITTGVRALLSNGVIVYTCQALSMDSEKMNTEIKKMAKQDVLKISENIKELLKAIENV